MRAAAISVIVVLMVISVSLLTWQKAQVWRAEDHFNKGSTYLNGGQWGKAMLEFNAAIKLKPDYAAAFNNRGKTYLKIGLLPLAFHDFDQAVTLAPRYAEAYYNRAVVFNLRGEYKWAYYDAKKAAELGFLVKPKELENLRRLSIKQGGN